MFSPSQIAAVAAGYFWDPAAGSGSGAAGFLLPEGNGKSAYDLVTPAANTAPTLGTINGQAVATYANGSPDQVARTAAMVTRGWTTSTLFAGWFSMSVAPGTVLSHTRTGGNLVFTLGGTRIDVGASDGASKESQHTVAGTYLSTPIYCECVIDFSQVATNRLQAWIDGVQLTPSVAATFGTSLLDALAYITTSGHAGDASTFNISNGFSHGMVYVCPLPSLAERAQMRTHKALK